VINRRSLSVKILLLAFLNVLLLGVVFFAIVRVQLRLDLGSFLLAPARDRILSVSRLIGLQLPVVTMKSWDQLLEQSSKLYPAEFYLFDVDAHQLAGKPVALPQGIIDSIRHGKLHLSRFGGGPGPNGAPPLTLIESHHPAEYWVDVHIPIWTSGHRGSLPGDLIWRLDSLWTNSFFFDYKPWIAIVLVVVLISMACWLPLIRGLTQSITRLTNATGQIAEGHFDVELLKDRHDELGHLSDSIRRMAQRLSGYVSGQRRFLGDIAHELCSPVARIQVALGILEQRATDDQAEYVADVGEEVTHISGLINELLAFSKTQVSAPTQLTAVNVAETVRKVVEREGSEKAQIETEVESGIAVMANPEYLFRSLANLVRNAVRYAGDSGPILVTAKNGGDEVFISVADHGPGLPKDELENVFKPFYRPEFARRRETGGVGLGLAIVRSCIESCGGSVACVNRAPHGLQVDIRLPAAQQA
jgi:two-component system sensor histidine kinase CpxA